jgi:hypothetical protein
MKADGQKVTRQRLMRFLSRQGGNTLSEVNYIANRSWVGWHCPATAASEPLFVPIMRFHRPHWRSLTAGNLVNCSVVARLLKDFPLVSVFQK